MSRGKYLSLEEALKGGNLDQFASEHPIGDRHPRARSRFKTVLKAMARGTLEDRQTSVPGTSGGCSGTRTRPGTSEDA